MKGDIFQSATLIATSVRGFETLNTFSSLLNVPLRPVAASMAAVSSDAEPAAPATEYGASAKQHAPRMWDIFSIVLLLHYSPFWGARSFGL
jgi:hypothetical protein